MTYEEVKEKLNEVNYWLQKLVIRKDLITENIKGIVSEDVINRLNDDSWGLLACHQKMEEALKYDIFDENAYTEFYNGLSELLINVQKTEFKLIELSLMLYKKNMLSKVSIDNYLNNDNNIKV